VLGLRARPEDPALGLLDRHVVDARLAAAHEAGELYSSRVGSRGGAEGFSEPRPLVRPPMPEPRVPRLPVSPWPPT
jgi:hypothetical protein